MADIPFSLQLEGGIADQHELPAYDGFQTLAGMAFSLALTANYAGTGIVRHRGAFAGRSLVRATALQQGSVLSSLTVKLGEFATGLYRGALSQASTSQLFYDLYRHVLERNLGQESEPDTDELNNLLRQKGGDVEALVAATEASIRQGHAVIGEGADVMNIYGGRPKLNSFNSKTKNYVNNHVVDDTLIRKDVSVASFNVNTGYGGVYDFDLRRVISIQVTGNTLPTAKSVLAWGLSQYAEGNGQTVSLTFFRWLALDETPKKYIVVNATMPGD